MKPDMNLYLEKNNLCKCHYELKVDTLKERLFKLYRIGLNLTELTLGAEEHPNQLCSQIDPVPCSNKMKNHSVYFSNTKRHSI